MRCIEIRFDDAAPAMVMVNDLVHGLGVRVQLEDGSSPGLTIRLVIPDHLRRMVHDITAIHGGRVVGDREVAEGDDLGGPEHPSG